jgi:Hemerythrin HHE cation binding domain
MTTPGIYRTDVSDMFAVHKALTGALDAAPTYVAKAGVDSERVDVIGSFYENVIELLHVHHAGEDELVYPLLEERCTESRSELERIDVNALPIRQRVFVENDSALVDCQSAVGVLGVATPA